MKNEFLKSLNKNEKLLYTYSWSWSCNGSKKKEDNNFLLISLEEITDLDGSLDYIIKTLLNYRKKYRNIYEDISIENVRIHQGRGEYESKTFLVGKRLETDEEVRSRLYEIKKNEEDKISIENQKKLLKEKNEKEEYLRLKNKFEPV